MGVFLLIKCHMSLPSDFLSKKGEILFQKRRRERRRRKRRRRRRKRKRKMRRRKGRGG
jgi:rRNA processing protein Gar1